ncbi:MAG: hypothetical protein JWO80_5225 [Bryobacterales bacterium]|nr:hypothetical protein [Bryobacterales bacterium]
MIRKGQVRWLAKADILGQASFIVALVWSPRKFAPHPYTIHKSICRGRLLMEAVEGRS